MGEKGAREKVIKRRRRNLKNFRDWNGEGDSGALSYRERGLRAVLEYLWRGPPTTCSDATADWAGLCLLSQGRFEEPVL